MSSNPFRKKAPATMDSTRAGSPKSSLRSEDPITAGTRKSKPLKRVRVLSPPPLSPDSPEWQSDEFQPPAPLSSNTMDYGNYYPSSDPFNGLSTDDSDRESATTPRLSQRDHQSPSLDTTVGARAPGNPFSKALQDIEGSQTLQKERKEEGEALKAANADGRALNVDAFQRLLMTGKATDEVAPASTLNDEFEMKGSAATPSFPTKIKAPEPSDSGDEETLTESSMSEEEEEEEEEDRSIPYAASSHAHLKQDKKVPPPPPPSSRHGKSLQRYESTDQARQAPANDYGQATGARRGPGDQGDLALGYDGAIAEEVVKEADSSPVNPVPSRTSSIRKSAPAPPPPRGRARSDSRPNDQWNSQRTSLDEMPQRSDSVRSGGNAPLPPPPRRPHAASKPSSQPPTPSVPSYPNFFGQLSPPTDANKPEEAGELASPAASTSSAPRPPPARHSSTRRPPSLHSVEAPSRRVSSENRRESFHAPPPPPPRHHGFAPASDVGPLAVPADSGKSADILADLDALQREVDALRGKMT
ncbi:hypothetical protein AAL_06052 [Moelleriella libera RCEF 2490]|uniref:Uncharacterized protein n=1 Tax=Moelleriella libera RCEF 2490 TaxID=1081109 RepID=A0A167ZB88_9HYPO|nr:hypothetical protein AAL_06052 [Moelleriella libera RCEF 2490]